MFSVILESARIARGAVQKLNQLTVDSADAVVIPGGFGAAKNLSDFAFKVRYICLARHDAGILNCLVSRVLT